MPRLSIVIPFLGNGKLLEDSLLSVLENRPASCEVIVVCARPYRDPYDLKGEVRFVEAPRRGGVACVNRGIEVARSDLVHVLACGVLATPGWTDAAAAHFDHTRVAAVAPLVLDDGQPDRVLAAGMAYGRGGTIRVLGAGEGLDCQTEARPVLCPHPAAAFYRKTALQWAGALATDLDRPAASIDLGLLLRQARLQTVLEPTCRVRARPELVQGGSAFRQALDAERLFWQWAPRLGLFAALALHGFAVAADCWRWLPRPAAGSCLLGRLAGFLWARDAGPQKRRLEKLLQRSRHRPPPPRPHFLGPADRRAAPAGWTAKARRQQAGIAPLRGGLGQ